MPQPQLSGSPTTCTFGGLSLPNGQGTLSNINLNDVINTFLQEIQVDHANRSLGIQPLIARAKSVYVSDDFLNKIFGVRIWYSETNNPIAQFLATLSQAGEQQLSFDGSTAILAKYRGVKQEPKMIRRYAPYLWEIQLEFICREPWFKDIAATTSATTTVVSAPTAAPSATALAGGALAVGTYRLQYTYTTASGETAPSPALSLPSSFPVSDYRTSRVEVRGGSRSAGFSVQQASMNNLASRSRSIRGIVQSQVRPAGNAVTLTSGTQQISVGAVTFPSWATTVNWYFTSDSPTQGFTVSNANGNAFTLNTAGNGTGPPVSTPATAFTITYAGSVFIEPVFTVTIPSSNPNSVMSLVLKNTMATETLTINFPGTILGGRATTLTIDCSAWTITDQAGNSYDYTGSMTHLYGPAGQANTFSALMTGTPADASGVTLSATYNPRWETI